MQHFKAKNRSFCFILLVILTIISDLVIISASIFIHDYMLNIFLKLFLICFNLYQMYYYILSISLKYSCDEEGIFISRFFGINKIYIPYGEIEKYTITSGNINAIQLNGYCIKKFALGLCVLDKFGPIRMFVTSNEKIFYLKTTNTTYGLSPENYQDFEANLKEKAVNNGEWQWEANNTSKIYKDNYFKIPLFIVTILILFLTLRPVWLMNTNSLPGSMPLSFNSSFSPTLMGSNKDFVFRQMLYGAFNMAILFCMYYAAYFNARYSKKIAYAYIYVSLIIAFVFIIIQQRILVVFT